MFPLVPCLCQLPVFLVCGVTRRRGAQELEGRIVELSKEKLQRERELAQQVLVQQERLAKQQQIQLETTQIKKHLARHLVIIRGGLQLFKI